MSRNTTEKTIRPEPYRRCPLCGQNNRRLPRSRYSRDGWLLKSCWQCEFLYLENPPPVESPENGYEWPPSQMAEDEHGLEVRPVSERMHSLPKRWRLGWPAARKLEAFINRYVCAGNLLDVGYDYGCGGHFPHLPCTIVPYEIVIAPDSGKLPPSLSTTRSDRIIRADALTAIRSMPPATMNGIVMQSLLEYDLEPLEVLQEAKRVLRDNGVMIIKVPNVDCWNRRHWHGKEWPGFRFPDHVNYFTPRTLSQIVSRAGLSIVRFAWHDRLPTSDHMWIVAANSQSVVNA